jgi:hypothetical protein
MRKLIRFTTAVLFLAFAIGFAPRAAHAVGYEDSLDSCAYPQGFDVFIMRPLSFTAMIGGASLLVIGAPIWASTDARDVGTITHNLVVEPARFTFVRRIGQCNEANDSY